MARQLRVKSSGGKFSMDFFLIAFKSLKQFRTELGLKSEKKIDFQKKVLT